MYSQPSFIQICCTRFADIISTANVLILLYLSLCIILYANVDFFVYSTLAINFPTAWVLMYFLPLLSFSLVKHRSVAFTNFMTFQPCSMTFKNRPIIWTTSGTLKGYINMIKNIQNTEFRRMNMFDTSKVICNF